MAVFGISVHVKIMTVLFLVVLLIMASHPGRAQVQYPLLLDKTGSSKAGAHCIIAAHRGIYGLENRFLNIKWTDEDNFTEKAAGISFRLGKTILLDNVLDHLSFLIQHEVFGHGARYREFGYKNNSYRLNLLFPYGNGKGWAIRGRPEVNRKISPHENMASIIGGSESNTVLSNILRFKWLQRGKMNYRETILYLFSANDLGMYILRTKYNLRGEAGNDVLSYLTAINTYQGYPHGVGYKLTLDRLAGQAFINMLNPFNYFSVYAYFYTYLWSGEENFNIPMIHIGNMRYIPSFRLGLSPFGSEFYFENFFALSSAVIHVYFRYGDPTFHKFWGLGLHGLNLMQDDNLTIHAQVDLWDQPSLLLGGETVKPGPSGLGGALMATLFYKLAGAGSRFQLAAQIGYKTAGFLEGENLRAGFIARLGLSLIE
ncbi:MAG: hypothetical protein ACLFVG_00110 [Candidatus Aminicenantes bacterium]